MSQGGVLLVLVKNLTHFGFASCLILFSGVSWAIEAGNDIRASVTVIPSCDLEVTQHIDFGKVLLGDKKPVIAEGKIQVRCTKGTEYTITIDNKRNFEKGTDKIPYQLFQDRKHHMHWGHTALSGKRMVSTSIAPQEVSIYALVPPVMKAKPGTYKATNHIDTEW